MHGLQELRRQMGYALLAAAAFAGLLADESAPVGIEKRTPWTGSRLVGSPEPPLPYTVEPVYTKIKWKRPMYVLAEPDTNALWVILQGGEANTPSRIVALEDDAAAANVVTVHEWPKRLLYAVTFAPDYRDSRAAYLFSNGPTGSAARRNRISRFTVVGRPSRLDKESEEVIIEWESAGHDGGDLAFGADGMLYIASGDGTSDSDTNVSGQDVSNLLGAVLRIDVRQRDGDRLYTIPPDNPFLETKNARPELWAFGLRNPWRMSVDAKTGHIWVGNNGQDLWETVHFIRRGDNYGWSVYEGNHPFYLNRKLGPAPFVPPTIEHHHQVARSLTGGVVYYGESLPDLNGVYVYGDYSTGRIWGARHDGKELTWHRELADTTLQVAGFGIGHRGDLLVVDLGGGLFRLRLATKAGAENHTPFPRALSQTGLFASVSEHRMAAGVIPYSVNAPGWADGAVLHRYLALPGESQIDYRESNGWEFPNGAVLAQTLSLDRRRVETRVLLRQQNEWAGYSYRWNEAQTDATLVGREGEDMELTAGERRQTWRIPSRAECLSCHSRAVNYVLGMTGRQMNREHDYGGVRANQLHTLAHLNIFKKPLPKSVAELPKLAAPYDEEGPVGPRARAYLHANCACCHVEAGGGNAQMNLRADTKTEKMKLIGARPLHNTFGIENAMLVAPGEPDRSVLIQRVSRRERGQMPPLVSRVVDRRAVKLLREWIGGMKPAREFVRAWTIEDLTPSLGELRAKRSFKKGETAFRDLGCNQCHRFQKKGGGIGPDLDGIAARLARRELLESLVEPSKRVAPEFAATLIQTRQGGVHTGRVESEDDEKIVLRTTAFLAEPLTLRKADVVRRAPSKESAMPTGILNTLEKEEVLDLLAYLLADGKEWE